MVKRSRRGAALRATRRANVANQQLEHAMSEHNEETRLLAKDDADLFVLDTARLGGGGESRNDGKRRRRDVAIGGGRGNNVDKSKNAKYEHSEREERQIQRLIRLHGKEGTIALAYEGRARNVSRSGGLGGGVKLTSTGVPSSTRPSFDLWGSDAASKATSMSSRRTGGTTSSSSLSSAVVPSTTAHASAAAVASARSSAAVVVASSSSSYSATRKDIPPRLAVEVAHPGQSYRPDLEQHQDAIGVALSIEIRRAEALEYRETPVSDGISDHVKAYMIDGDATTDDDTDEDEDEGGEGTGMGNESSIASARVGRREGGRGKLTRAQRNKQRRVKAERLEIKERKTRKAFLHQANEVRAHDAAVRRAEFDNAHRRDELRRLRAERMAKPLGSDVWCGISRCDPISAPALPVALTEELNPTGGGVGDGGTGVEGSAVVGAGMGAGSLRTMMPKGSIVTDRVESMAARNMINKRRASGGRRIVQGKKRNNRVRGPEGGTEYMLM